jgi:separase
LNSAPPKNGAAAIAASQAQDEHLFLILDKHTQIFPWESLNCMRGRSISRVPSLPFLLDQMRLAKTMSCRAAPAPRSFSLASPLKSAPETPAPRSRAKTPRKGKMLKAIHQEEAPLTLGPAAVREDERIGMNARRVYYILNPSGDLHSTQQHFEPWLAGMRQAAGWKGVQGRKVTELEMTAAMKECDLVL